MDFDPFVVPPGPKRPKAEEQSEFKLWMKLDSCMEPGLMDTELKFLLARCKCGLTMTRRVYNDHECLRVVSLDHEVIDLTGDNDAT